MNAPYVYKPRERAKYLAHPLYRDMSLRDLERETGVSKIQLSRWLKGQAAPRASTIAPLLKCLGCEIADLRRAIRVSNR